MRRLLIRAWSDENFAARGRVFEPCGEIHRVAQDGIVPPIFGAHLAGNHRSAVDSDMHSELGSVSPINCLNRLHHLERCPQSPLRVIFMSHRRAEERHDFIADELVDRAFVFLHDWHKAIKAGID